MTFKRERIVGIHYAQQKYVNMRCEENERQASVFKNNDLIIINLLNVKSSSHLTIKIICKSIIYKI